MCVDARKPYNRFVYLYSQPSTYKMNARVREILDRLETIDSETAALREELRNILEAEKDGGLKKADFLVFKDTTCRLLTEFLNAPNHVLSYDDIRIDVMFDECASDSAVRSVVKRARQEMKSHRDCHVEIRSISKKGYKLEVLKICQVVSNSPEIRQEHDDVATQFDTVSPV